MGIESYFVDSLNVIYKTGALIHRNTYEMNVLQRAHIGKPVIGIGNLSFGGSGKTVIARSIAEELMQRGHTVGVVMRSYGATDGPHIVDEKNSDPNIVGDEAAMVFREIRRSVTEGICHPRPDPLPPESGEGVVDVTKFHVGSGKDKTATAKSMVKREPQPDVILVDDAFQHHRLQQDLRILIWPRPGAILREFKSAERHADILLVPNGIASPRPDDKTVYFVKEVEGFEKLEGTGCSHSRPWMSLEEMMTEAENRRVIAVAGLGPETDFFHQVQKTSPHAEAIRLPDHADYRRHDVVSRLNAAMQTCDMVITTAKDAVKMPVSGMPTPVYVMRVQAKFLTNEEMIWSRIEKTIKIKNSLDARLRGHDG